MFMWILRLPYRWSMCQQQRSGFRLRSVILYKTAWHVSLLTCTNDNRTCIPGHGASLPPKVTPFHPMQGNVPPLPSSIMSWWTKDILSRIWLSLLVNPAFASRTSSHPFAGIKFSAANQVFAFSHAQLLFACTAFLFAKRLFPFVSREFPPGKA